MAETKLALLEAIERMAALEKDLKQLGVPLEAIPDVIARVDEYADLKEGLDTAREQQFSRDAYEVLGSAQAASNKAVKALTIYLRHFAEHVASHTLHLVEQYGGDPRTLVDHIPPMNETDQEEDGA